MQELRTVKTLKTVLARYNNDVMPVPERVWDDSWAYCKKEIF